jgi:hypothetical protein
MVAGTFILIIFCLGLWLVVCIPIFRVAIRNVRLSKSGSLERIRNREWVLLILMPIEGLVCYHLLEDFDLEKPAFDWQYIGSLIAVPFIVATYFFTRKRKHKMSGPLRNIAILILLAGIVIATCMAVRFAYIGGLGCAVILTPMIPCFLLALPFYALLPVVILLAGEIYSLVSYRPAEPDLNPSILTEPIPQNEE